MGTEGDSIVVDMCWPIPMCQGCCSISDISIEDGNPVIGLPVPMMFEIRWWEHDQTPFISCLPGPWWAWQHGFLLDISVAQVDKGCVVIFLMLSRHIPLFLLDSLHPRFPSYSATSIDQLEYVAELFRSSYYMISSLAFSLGRKSQGRERAHTKHCFVIYILTSHQCPSAFCPCNMVS